MISTIQLGAKKVEQGKEMKIVTMFSVTMIFGKSKTYLCFNIVGSFLRWGYILTILSIYVCIIN